MTSNQIKITDKGLLNINRKLVDSRKFNSSALINVGGVLVESGTASTFDKGSYLYNSNITFESSNNVIITFKGTYAPSEDSASQTAWFLSSATNNMSLQFVNDYPRVVLPSGNLIDFDFLEGAFNNEMTFQVILNVYYPANSGSQRCDVIVDTGEETFRQSRILSSPIDFTQYNTIALGNNTNQIGTPLNYFWEGSIDLMNFSIKENFTNVFTPTEGYTLEFTQLAISDGKFPFPQEGSPVERARHMYTYDIQAMSRSSNTLLLTAQLEENSKLVIREIGLYARIDGSEEFLFGYMDDINVDKGTNVPYRLLITVNIAISAVNVVGFPDSDSFIFRQVKPALLKNFTTVRDTNSYVITNLERIIRMNSLQPIGPLNTIQSIGYNTPQIVYRAQQQIAEQEDCYSAVQTYSKLHKDFHYATEIRFNPNYFDRNGDIVVSEEGVATNFSTNNYIELPPEIDMSKDWTFDLAFSNTDLSGIKTILSAGNLAVTYDEEDDEKIISVTYYPFLKLWTEDSKIKATVDSSTSEDTTIEAGTKYYIKLSYNFSTSNLQVLLSTDGDTYSQIANFTKSFSLVINTLTLGVDITFSKGITESDSAFVKQTTSDPFVNGTIYLNNCSLTQEDNDWTPMQEVILQDNELLQYYHLMDFNRLSYKMYDICDSQYYINFIENLFTGNGDRIDFTKDKFTLCMKVNLKNDSSKILLNKICDANRNEFFKVEFVKSNPTDPTYDIKISVLVEPIDINENAYTYTMSLPSAISSAGVYDYTSAPFLLTIVKEGSSLTIYRNNDVISSQSLPDPAASFEGSYITNYAFSNIKEGYVDVTGLNYDFSDSNLEHWSNEDIIAIQNYLFNEFGLAGVREEDIKDAIRRRAFITGYASYTIKEVDNVKEYTFLSVGRMVALSIKQLNINYIDVTEIDVDWKSTEHWSSQDFNKVRTALEKQGLVGIDNEDIKKGVGNKAFITGYARYTVTSYTIGDTEMYDYSFESATKEEALYETGKFVSDIILIDSAITMQELNYITNLTDTNFGFAIAENE